MPLPATDPTTRAPSGPITGAIRQAIRFGVSIVIGWLGAKLPWLVSDVPGTTETVTIFLAGLAATGLAALGKTARDKGWPLIGNLI